MHSPIQVEYKTALRDLARAAIDLTFQDADVQRQLRDTFDPPCPN